MLLGKGAKDAGPSTRSALLPLMAESYLTYFATTRYYSLDLVSAGVRGETIKIEIKTKPYCCVGFLLCGRGWI